MDRNVCSLSVLDEYIGKQLTEKVLFGRNYFYCEEGRVLKYNDTYVLHDFNDMNDKIFGDPAIDARNHTAKSVGNKVWVKRLPVDPSDCECEAYIVISISLNKDNKIRKIKCYTEIYEELESMWVLTPEIVDEINSLCEDKYLPEDYTFIGKKVTADLKSIFHLNNAGCDYSLHTMSGYRNVTTSIFIYVDESDFINKMGFVTNGNCSMFSRPTSSSDCYTDLLDALILMHDKI